jgi:hypothetical protein
MFMSGVQQDPDQQVIYERRDDHCDGTGNSDGYDLVVWFV